MGCDIHPYAEVYENGKWERADVEVPDDRNYWTFGILANVRNGYGFAGVDTGDAVRPISEPRGLPDDRATFDTDGKYEYGDKAYVWFGDHSFSWLTLAELKAYPIDQAITVRGVVSGAQRDLVRAGKCPDSWCGGKSPMTDEDEHMEWKRPLADAAWLFPKIIQALDAYAHGKYPPEHVRIVFGFDS